MPDWINRHVELYDSEGELWVWDGRRVYYVKAEEEMIANKVSKQELRQNGYLAYTLETAKRWLD